VELDALQRALEALRAENEALKQENARLRQLLEKALREGKRQAAPFSKRPPKANPCRPGRKHGRRHGRHGRGAVPTRIDERIEVPLPNRCPGCGGAVSETGEFSQYQTELPPPRVHTTEFRVHVGRCRGCGQRVQGRDSRQSSDAGGAAAAQVGPRALALAAELNKGFGLPYGKVAAVLQRVGLGVSRGGICRALGRLGRKAEPTYNALVEQVRGSPQVTPDETGWKVGGKLWWMWVAATPEATVYSIQPGRGFEEAAQLLGADFAGFLVRDGWGVYRRFEKAMHQTCLDHLLRRCRQLIEQGEATRFPRAVRELLWRGLELRDWRQASANRAPAAARRVERLEQEMDGLLRRAYRSPANRRFARHLRRERTALFTFLHCPGLDATNWRAEQAIRPMVVTRKVWGGNRTARGAQTQQRLVSIIQTCRQHNASVLPLFQQLLCSRDSLTLSFRPR
jgi:transposase